MEEERARVLLREERQRLERLLASVDADHERVTPADAVAEDLPDGADRRIGEETDEAVARQLNLRMEALQQAEGRLAAGTYGRSVLSGRLIPDERLEAFPLAELTADEEAAREHVERPFAEAVERAADGEDRAGRDPALLDAARLGPSREPFQVLQDPAVQDNPLVEDDETTFDEPPPELDPGHARRHRRGRHRPHPTSPLAGAASSSSITARRPAAGVRRSWLSPGVGPKEAADGEGPDRGEDGHQQQGEEPGRRSQPAPARRRGRVMGMSDQADVRSL